MLRLILASKSKRRKEILDKLGIKYEIVKDNFEEISTRKGPRGYIAEITYKKLECINSKIKEGIIIVADTIVFANDEIMGKPKNKKEAFEFIKSISGKTTKAMTLLLVKDNYQNVQICELVETEVEFRKISEEEIIWYIENEEDLLDKAGYSIDGKAAIFVKEIRGDYYNVVGLPLAMLCNIIKRLGYSIDKDFEKVRA